MYTIVTILLYCGIHRWHADSGLEKFKLSRERLLFLYFLAAASIFEAEKSQERLAWITTAAFIEAITATCDDEQQRRAFVQEFTNIIGSHHVNER